MVEKHRGLEELKGMKGEGVGWIEGSSKFLSLCNVYLQQLDHCLHATDMECFNLRIKLFWHLTSRLPFSASN